MEFARCTSSCNRATVVLKLLLRERGQPSGKFIRVGRPPSLPQARRGGLKSIIVKYYVRSASGVCLFSVVKRRRRRIPTRGRSSFPIQEIYSWLRARIFPQIQLRTYPPALLLPPSFSQMMLKASLDAARPQPQPTSEARERLFHTKSLISILVHAFVSFSYLEIDFLAHRISSHLISSHT